MGEALHVVMVAPAIMDWIGGKLVPIAMDSRRQCPPYGLYLLAGLLREAGHSVSMADLIAQGHGGLETFGAEIMAADMICITATSMSWPAAKMAAAECRRLNPTASIVAGGIHPTMFDDYVLATSEVDYVVRGEGERALPHLAAALAAGTDLGEVTNLSWLGTDRRVRRTRSAPKIPAADFAMTAPPAYDLLPRGAYAGLSLESSRGCAFDCSFCSTSYRRTYRALSPEAFVDRVEFILPHRERTTGGTLYIVDDEFSLNWKRAAAIGRLLSERKLDVPLIFDSRANEILQPGYLEAIVPHTHRFLIGAECGYDEGLEKIGKGTTCELLTSAAQQLDNWGLAERADFSFILGLPWEGRQEVERTVRFAMTLHARYGVRVLLQWYCQIPGSRLWDAARSDGLVSEVHYDDFGFFRDLYLFRSGVRLSVDDIYEVSELIFPVMRLSRAVHEEPGVVNYAFPEAIAKYFPPFTRNGHRNGLVNLREVAGGAINADSIPVGHPLRHIG